MDNPGAFSLGDFSVGGPGVLQGTPVLDLAGLSSLGLQARFAYGGSAADSSPRVEAYVQTSLDQGQTWLDLACFAFTGASGVLVANIVAGVPVLPPVAPQNQTMADDTGLDGPLGDRLRAMVRVTGTYTSSTLLSLWAVAR